MADECCRPSGDSQGDPREPTPLERRLFAHILSLPDLRPQQFAAIVSGFTVREHFEQAHPDQVSRCEELYRGHVREDDRPAWLLGYRFRDEPGNAPPTPAAVAATPLEKLATALNQLTFEGRADLADTCALLVAMGELSVANALDAIDTATTLGIASAQGEVTDEQCQSLIGQVAVRHITGEQG
jgi:hypothetical protein